MSQLSSEAAFAADIAACRHTLRGGSKTFFAASLLLPRDVRAPASALYAFCRVADDAIDEAPSQHAARQALEILRVRLRRAYAGLPDANPTDRALAHVVHRHAIPIEIPEALLEGFAWDSERRRYETLSDVLAYAARVAGTVGAMMSLLMGGRAAPVLARACDLGVAMQLSNIARDVGEDARNGRLYLPRSWLREAGVDPDAWLQNPQFTSGIAAVVGRLLELAEQLYARAAAGVSALPLACRPGIEAARLMYGEIGRQVARNGLDSISRRAVVSGPRKLALLGASVAGALSSRPMPDAPALDETRFLVDAATALSPPRWGIEAKTLDDRIGFVFDLFARLGERDRVPTGGG
jgi:phytoene synthase